MADKIEHHRRVITRDNGDVVYVERRGVRVLYATLGKDGEPLSTEAMRQEIDRTGARAVTRALQAIAGKMLRSAGERRVEQVACGVDPKVRGEALYSWVAEIGARRGVLAPETLAAKFSASVVLLAGAMTERSDAAQRIEAGLAFAQAYADFYFEALGYGRLAHAGFRAEHGRAHAAPARRSQSEKRMAIVAEHYAAILRSETRPAYLQDLAIANTVQDEVNKTLAECSPPMKPLTVRTIRGYLKTIKAAAPVAVSAKAAKKPG